MDFNTDILIIGAGITGCAVSRELSRYCSSVTVIDRASDVAEGATKANSGIVHAGYDALPGTQKAFYNVRGAAMFPDLCRELGVPYKRCGALVIALDDRDMAALDELYARGLKNGVPDLEIIDRDTVLSMEPNLNPDVKAALYVPGSAIVSPYELAFAMADDAALNGVVFRLREEVLSVEKTGGGFIVKTNCGSYTCRVLVNCSGSSGAGIHNLLSSVKLSMTHRRGQYYLLDRSEAQPFSRTVFQCPSAMGKGVLITPTVHGNLLLGPTAEDIPDPLDTATTSEGLETILQKAARTWPGLSVRNNITNFSGIRAHLSTKDFSVGSVDDCPGCFEAIGIESPGLSSAPAIGSELAARVSEYLSLTRKASLVPFDPPRVPFHDMSDEQRAAAVASDSAYGNIICRCEMVTEAEIRRAINRPVGARSIDGVKRRTRAGMGRCQGGFCMPRVAAILSEETGIPLQEITKDSENSRILCDSVERFLKGI